MEGDFRKARDLENAAAHPQLLFSKALKLAMHVVLGINVALALWGLVMAFVFCYREGQYGNYYPTVWICGFAIIMCVQAWAVLKYPVVTASRRARFWSWIWYCTWMICAAIIIIVCYGIAQADQFGWAFLWLCPLAIIVLVAIKRRAQGKADGGAVTADDVNRGKAPCCSGAAWNSCCKGFGACLGWSSLFWLSFLGFFLALQAGFLAYDKVNYPPPGKLVEVQLSGTSVRVQYHIQCVGPAHTGLSTFIMEAGGGAPGISMAGIAEGLAAAGRRACWYDRLGYGWSAIIVNPTTSTRAVSSLRQLLATVGENGPFIIAGHSAGGQLALQFAGLQPERVAGVVLLDSYDEVAIHLEFGGELVEERLDNGTVVQVASQGSMWLTAGTAALLDVLRVITPFAFGRFATSSSRGGYKYAAEMNALYGTNSFWHSQWVDVLGLTSSNHTDGPRAAAGRPPFWYGTAWPYLGPKPVLLLPAAATLKLPAGCDASFATNTTCQAAVLQADKMFFPKLYLAYKDTLSSNTSLLVQPGDHSFPTERPQEVVAKILDKFRGW